MSRFVLDCAVLRPVSDQANAWQSTAQRRAWASPNGGYHEAKVARALLDQSAATMVGLLAGRSAWFTPDLPAALGSAVLAAAAGRSPVAVATSRVDPIVMQDAVTRVGAAAGLRPELLDVDSDGRIDPRSLADLPVPAVLVTCVANQEIGTRQIDLHRWARETGSGLVLDASGAFGWADLPSGWTQLVLDPRAWGGVAGAVAVVSTGSQRSREPFENVPAAVTAGLTAESWAAAGRTDEPLVRAQIERIASRVRAEVDGVEVRGGTPLDLPQVLSISVLYVDAEAMQTALDARGFAVGSGSACASRSGQPSHVLAAIGGLTGGNLRIGLPPGLSDGDVDRFVDALVEVVDELRAQTGTQGL